MGGCRHVRTLLAVRRGASSECLGGRVSVRRLWDAECVGAQTERVYIACRKYSNEGMQEYMQGSLIFCLRRCMCAVILV